MGIELARAYVSVRGDASELPGDLATVKNIVEEALSDARLSAAGLLAKFAQMSSAFLAMGSATVAQQEQTQVSFETMIGSVEETKKLLADITQFAAVTPFEMPQLLQVTQELLTFGERGDQLMETLKLLGDASGGTASKFQILGIVFNQIRGVGKLLTQDFRQLSTRGILFLKDIQKYYKLGSEQEAQKMLSEGKVTFEDVRGILKMLTGEGERFYNSMIRQSQTLIGLQSTYNDAWNILASKMAAVTAPLDKLILKFKIDLVGAIDAVTTASNGMVGGMLRGATASAKLGSAVLAGQLVMRLFGASLSTVAKGAGIAGIVLSIGAAIGGLTAAFWKSAAGMKAWEQITKDFKKVWMNLKEAFSEFTTSVAEGFENAFGVTVTGALTSASEVVAGWITTVSKWIVYLSEVFAAVMSGISYLWRNGWDLLTIASIDFVVGIISSIQMIQVGWRAFAGWMGQLTAGLIGMFTAMKDGVVQIFIDMKDRVVAEMEALWAGMKALASGENPFDAMDAAFEKSMAEAALKGRKILQSPVEAFVESFHAAQKEVDLGDLVGDDTKRALLEERQHLTDMIALREQERLKRRQEKEEKKDEDKKDEAKKSKETALVKTGRYGFEQFGTAIQDAILKGAGGDKQGQMVSLLESGNKIQEQQLDQLKKNGGGLGP